MSSGGSLISKAMTLFSIGYWIYNMLNPKKSGKSKAQEVSVNTFSRNLPVPICYGTNRYAGEILAIADNGVTTVEYGSKGGMIPGQEGGTQTVYYAEFAIGFSEGEIENIIDILINDETLVSLQDNFDYEIYYGSDDQLPNEALSEFFENKAITACSFKKTAYLFLSGVLGSFNTIPTVEAEVSGLLASNAILPYIPVYSSGLMGDEFSEGITTIKGTNEYTTTLWTREGYSPVVFCNMRTLTEPDIFVSRVKVSGKNYEAGNIIYYSDWEGREPQNGDWFEFNSSWGDSPTSQNLFNLWSISNVDTVNKSFSLGEWGYSNGIKVGDWLYNFDPDRKKYQIASNAGVGIGLVKNPILDEVCGINISLNEPVHYIYISKVSYYNMVSGAYRTWTPQDNISTAVLNPMIWTGLNQFNIAASANYLYISWNNSYEIDKKVRLFGMPYLGGPTVEINIPDTVIQIRFLSGINSSYNMFLQNGSKDWGITSLIIVYDDVTSPSGQYIAKCVGYGIVRQQNVPVGYGVGGACTDKYGNEYVVLHKNTSPYAITIMRLKDGKTFGEQRPVFWNAFIMSSQIVNYHNKFFIDLAEGDGNSIAWKNEAFMVGVNKSNYEQIPVLYNDRGNHGFIISDDGELYYRNYQNPAFDAWMRRVSFTGSYGLNGDGNDANPIECCYDFMTNKVYGMGVDPEFFDGSPYINDSGTWNTERDYCNDPILFDGKLERRFRYSDVFKDKTKGYDVVRNILQTCRAFLYYCDGLIKVKIQKNNEVPVHYFGLHEATFITNATSTLSKVYADFSAYPDNYWKGDILNFDDKFYIVINQTSEYIELLDNLPEVLETDYLFTLSKDNIKEHSFDWFQKKRVDIHNKLKLQYIDRDGSGEYDEVIDKYRTDVLEVDQTYDVHNKGIYELSFTMDGIKRNSQARRMIQFLSDYDAAVEFNCSFQTDIIGMLLCLGDIVGITYEPLGWVGKLFRITLMEEIQDFETKLELVEYVSEVFHDHGIPQTITNKSTNTDKYQRPGQVERFAAFEEHNNMVIDLFLKKPDNEKFWKGADIFLNKEGSDIWEKIGLVTDDTPSVKLSADINNSTTVIPFDYETLNGSFPASGFFFIGEEEIYYSSINSELNQFEGCIRGYNDSIISSHDESLYCSLRLSTVFKYYYDKNDIGKTLNFKAISVTIYNVYSDGNTAPIVSIVLNDYYLIPFSVALLKANIN